MIKVLGGGEVGSSIYDLILEAGKDVFLEDLEYVMYKGKKYGEHSVMTGDITGFGRTDILHVCIPYSDKFVEIVLDSIKEETELVIIHSTVKSGTTEEINRRKCRSVCVHSPVRGIHPNLVESLKTFDKFVGTDDVELFVKAKKHLNEIGIPVANGGGSRNTELAKIMSTTYYGWNIIFEKEMKKLCDKEGVDFDMAYTDWNNSYNSGYIRLGGMDHVVRPVLRDTEGKIGGHCITPNCKLMDTFLTRTIKNRNETY